MGRSPCCDKAGMKKGSWTPEEDIILVSYIQEHGPGNWTAVPTNAGLMRSSKSCRLRWTNYLRPGIKRGNFTDQEEKLILHLQALLGNRWAAIASYLPERTDNDIKNYWNTRLMKKLRNKPLSKQPNSRGQWERRLQTDIHKAKQALREALSLDNSSEDCHSEFMIKTTNVCNTYMSTENISRLLQGWMGSTPNPRGNRADSESTQHSATTTASTDLASIESFFGLDSSTQEVLESKPSCEGQVPLSMIETWLLDDDDDDDDDDVGQEDLIDMPLCYPLD